MNDLSAVRESVRAFCRSWFEERNAEGTIAFLTDGVEFVGTGEGEAAHGKDQLSAYIRQDIAELREPFSCALSVINGQSLAPQVAGLSVDMILKNSAYSWHLRGFFIMQEAGGAWRVRNLHFSEPGRSQRGAEHYPGALVVEEISRQRQKFLSESLPGGMMGGYIEEGFPFYFVNHRMLDYLGYESEAEFVSDIGGSVANCMHPDDRGMVDDAVNRQLAMRDEYTVEYRMKKRDGSYIWVHDVGQRVTAEDGRPAISSVCIDITAEKRMQQQALELYERELPYLTSEEGSVQGRLNLTRNRLDSYLSASDTAAAQVGDSCDDMLERFAASAADGRLRRELRQTMTRKEILAGYDAGRRDYRFSFLRRRPDGGCFWGSTSFRTVQNPETGDVMLFFCTTDTTEKKMQEEMLSRIADLDYDVIFHVDMTRDTYRLVAFHTTRQDLIPPQGAFRAVIRAIARQTIAEGAREDWVGRLDYGYMREQLAERDSYTFTVEMKSERGNPQVKRVQVFYISREMGRVCVACTDVTDIVRQEQRQKEEMAAALVAAEQANAAKTDFLSRMSHEIRTPMNAIIGMSAIAAQHIGDDERVSDCISKIGISSRFLLSLINDILDMSRIESGKMLLKNEKIPMADFLKEVNSICYSQAASKGVEYECIVDSTLDDYYVGDAMKLQQVLINILNNAIKFTGERGKVTLSVCLHRRTKNDAVLRFVVSDTGVGMSEEFLPHIFEPFSQETTGTTATYGGTGLGLAIARSIVSMMDGTITVRSIKGTGTEFTVEVKLGITDEEKLRHHQKKQTYNFSHLKTLVVDDDVVVCETAVVTLREMGVKAEWVDSGRKAIERVKELWEQKRFFDMILIDWKMPEMDGIETARRIRAIVGPKVTIIIITAYDWASIEHEARLAGVNLLMSKPMFKSSLISAFSKALGQEEQLARTEEPVEFDFTGKRILLAEDNALNTEVAVMLLESRGFAVERAENGLRALELFSKSSEGYYDAILMDIRMPLMDGLTATNSIRHLSNADAGSIPIIAMTANAFDDDVEKSKAAGMNAHLAKPIDPVRLYQTLYDFIFGEEA